MGPVGEILEELDKVPAEFQTVVVTGRNEGNAARPGRAGPQTSHAHSRLCFQHARVDGGGRFGDYQTRRADLVGSAGHGQALVYFEPYPGQEAANSDFLLERGAAGKVNRVEDLPYRIEQLLGSKSSRKWRPPQRRWERPQAARAVCEEVMKRVG